MALRREPFLSFRALSFTGVDYGHRAHTLAMKEIVLDEPVAQLGVGADGTPVTRVIFPNPAADSAAKDTAAPGPPPPPPPKRSVPRQRRRR